MPPTWTGCPRSEPLDPLTVLVTATWPVAELPVAELPVWLGALVIAGRDVAAETLALWPARAGV